MADLSCGYSTRLTHNRSLIVTPRLPYSTYPLSLCLSFSLSLSLSLPFFVLARSPKFRARNCRPRARQTNGVLTKTRCSSITLLLLPAAGPLRFKLVSSRSGEEEGRKDDNGGRGIKGARKKAASKATVFKRSFSPWISTGRYRYIDVYIHLSGRVE